MGNIIQSIPEAKLLLASLRSVGYTEETAIADIVDNCISAKAKHIDIIFETEKMRILILDDGIGKVGGSIGRYPKFVPEDYVILRLNPRFQKGEWVQWMQEMPPGSPPELLKAAETFSNLKLGFRGDLKFQQNPEVIEVAPLVEAAQTQFLDISFLM